MTLLMRDQENQEISKEIGKKMGEAMLRSLIEKLIADRRFDDIEKMAKDELYEEYHMIGGCMKSFMYLIKSNARGPGCQAHFLWQKMKMNQEEFYVE